MYVGRDFDPIDPGEEEYFQFDFAREIPTGVTIVSTTWVAAVAETSDVDDASASTRIMDPAIVNGTKSVQKVGGCIGGVRYVLEAKVVLSNTEKKSLWAHCECTEPG